MSIPPNDLPSNNTSPNATPPKDTPSDAHTEALTSAPSNEPPLAAAPIPPAPDATFRGGNIFFGPSGLRAGWRFTLYVLMLLVEALALGILFHFVHLRKLGLLWRMLISEILIFVVAVIPALVMSHVERRPFGAYGLPARSAFGKRFWVGALWGIASLSVLMFALWATGSFHISSLAVRGLSAFKFAAFYGALFLMVGFAEEFTMRGYSQFTLTDGIGYWPAAVILSLAFGALHLGNGGEAWLGIVGVVMIGLFFCLTLRRTGNLWFGVGFHAAWDWGESFLYSVPDSGQMAPGHLLHSSFQGSHWLTGGTVGPEGSVLILVLIPAIWIVFERSHREVRYVSPPAA